MSEAEDRDAIRQLVARAPPRGGRIAVVDFAAHDHEELRERHAHARLGFSDETMLALLAEAGFTAAPTVALPGETLTVKIWTGRRGTALPGVRDEDDRKTVTP